MDNIQETIKELQEALEEAIEIISDFQWDHYCNKSPEEIELDDVKRFRVILQNSKGIIL